MCGFLVVISAKNKLDFDENYLHNLIGHRGPDMSNFFLSKEKKEILYFARLSINDLSINANQPFEYLNYLLVANCEIYNFRELRKKLEHKYYFKSNSDAEVLLYSFIEWGEDFIKKIDGMFAIAIFNKKNKNLIIYRDRVGIKPLYYYHNNNYLIISSEFLPIVEILKKLKLEISLNPDSIENYFIGPFNFLHNTHVKGVFKVPPSNYLVFKNFIKYQKEYNSFSNIKKSNLSFFEETKNFDKIFDQNLSKHLVSDVPISVMLSGGLDSSFIATVASRNLKNRAINTATINIDDTLTEFEINNIRDLAKKINLENSILNVSSKNIINDIFKNISVYDDLQSSDAGYLTNFEIAKSLKKNNIKVVLVGDGADELLGGYSWFGLSKIPFCILPKKIKTFLYIYATSRIYSKKGTYKVYTKYYNEIKKFSGDYFDVITKNELLNQLPNNYLMKVDKPFMRCGIEARVPFLDNNVINFCISLKNEFKLKGYVYGPSSFLKPNEKYILREAFKKRLNTSVTSAKKKGFSISIFKMIQENKDIFKSVLLDEKSFLFNETKLSIEKNINKVEKSSYNPLKKQREIYIWKLFLFNIWKKKYAL